MEEQKTYYWSRTPGRFANKHTGVEPVCNKKTTVVLGQSRTPVPGDPKSTIEVTISLVTETIDKASISYLGTAREWYETLVETIHDASNVLQAKTGVTPTLVVCSVECLSVLECTIGYREEYNVAPSIADLLKPKLVDAEPYIVGRLSNKFVVMADPQMKSNEIHVVVLNPADPDNRLDQFKILILDMYTSQEP